MKHKIKNCSYILAVGIALLGFAGCKLDVTPTTNYNDASIWKNPSGIEALLYSQYGELKNFAFGRTPYLGSTNAFDAFTDVEKYTSTNEGVGTVNRLAFDPGRISASSSPGINYWSAGYSRIRSINEFLMNLDKNTAGIDSAKINQYRGEARFLRGYVYFWLVKLHGSVVLLDKATAESRQRSSEDSCYNFIAGDFTYAASVLPVVWPVNYFGRATKAAAYGMLARTWLYAASIANYDKKQFNADPLTGIAQAKAQQYYQNASDAAAQVIALADAGYYKLESDFNNLNNINIAKTTKEAIFMFSYQKPTFTHDWDLGFAPPRDFPSGGAIVYGVPTAEEADEFEMANGARFSWTNSTMAANPYAGREPRFYASILFNGAKWKGRTLDLTPNDPIEGYVSAGASANPQKTITGYYIKKFLDSTNTTIVANRSDQPWMEMRLAEVYLIHSEANAQLGNVAAAQTSLNKVRNRVGLPNTSAINTTDLMTAIEHERKVELAFEGHRYWDLRRWRKAHLVLDNVVFHGHRPNANGTYDLVDADIQKRYFPAKLYYLPIPQSEIQNNVNITQISGW